MCHVTCGGGPISRSRTCENGVVGDTGCDIGEATETDVCESQDCPGLWNLDQDCHGFENLNENLWNLGNSIIIY